MKLHIPISLRKAVIALFVTAAAAVPAHAADSVEQNGITYVRDDKSDSLSGTVETNGKESFVSIDGNKYFDYITVGDNDDDASGFAQFDGHVLSQGTVTIHSDSFAQVIRGYSFDATGQKVIIGDEGEELKKMTPVQHSTYTQPAYGGVLSFYSTGADTHNGPHRTLRVGSLQTYSGGYVNDVQTLIVSGGEDAERQASSSGDMDVRRNSDKNGYILTDISGNDLTITKGDFSLDTEATQFNMSSGDTTTTLDPDKMNTGDYGYVNSLTIGNEGSTVKALNDLQVINGIEIGESSALNMNSFALEASALSGQVTNASALTVGDFTTAVYSYEKNAQGEITKTTTHTGNAADPDLEHGLGTKDAAKEFKATLTNTSAKASVTNGTMDVTGNADGTYTINKVSATNEGTDATLVLDQGDFVLGANATVEMNGGDLLIQDTTLTAEVILKGADSNVTLSGADEFTSLTLNGGNVGALTLDGTVHSVEGVQNFAVVNLVLSQWDANATGITLSEGILNNFTLNINFEAWNAEAEYKLHDQMTLLSGLSEATLAGFTVGQGGASTFALPIVTADGFTIGVEVVENEDKTYSVVAKVIPEPTTATLSLLALAGLAARRRRK